MNIVCTIAVVVSCGGPSTQPDSRPQITETTKSELEALLTARTNALTSGDRKAFDATYDATRPAFRRWQAGEFEEAARLGFPTLGRVVEVQVYGDRYVRAWVEESLDTPGFGRSLHVRRLYFRREGGRWLLTEPARDELGGERTKTAGGHTLTYWGLDEDIADLFLGEYRNARVFALKAAAAPVAVAGDLINARLIPTAEIAGLNEARGGALVRWGDDNLSMLPLGISLEPSRTALSENARLAYRHPLLSWVRGKVLPGAESRLGNARWLDIGWLEHRAWTATREFYQPTCAGVPPLTLKQLSDGLPPPASPAATLELHSQYYTYVRTMFEYFDATFGAPAYWDLLKEFGGNADAKANMVKVLRVTPEQFYSGWLAWAKQKYC